MRVTIKLDAFDHADSDAFAVLWLDRETQRWSREGHEALDLPTWGILRELPQGRAICDATRGRTLMMLQALAFEACAPQDVQEARGPAEYFPTEGNAADTGHWHVQCVEREPIQAEHDSFCTFDDISGEIAGA
jgi:hypothetical protein